MILNGRSIVDLAIMVRQEGERKVFSKYLSKDESIPKDLYQLNEYEFQKMMKEVRDFYFG